jgi:hypothetical protein
MSIRVRGTIAIVRKSSRRGDFNVGDLATEIGEFEVKDSLIEEYEPGHYTGEFLIKWIEPDSFAWRGKVFVKNRATLDEIFIDEAEEGGTPPAPPPEPDPIDSTPEAAPVAVKTTHRHQSTEASVSASPSPSAPAPSSTQAQAPAHASPEKLDKPTGESTTKDARAADTNAADVDADAVLFGDELHALLMQHAPMKLDPTVDRTQFRTQRDRLKALGYGFDPKAQTWSMRELAEEQA